MEDFISKKIENDTDMVAKRLLEGEVFLMQTDTVFGLICCADNELAARKIIDIKHRNHPAFGLFVSGVDMAKQYVEMDARQEEVFHRVFPGHFTLIFKANISTYSNTSYRNITINSNTTNRIISQAFGTKLIENEEVKTLGLRVPKSDFCIEIVKKVGKPLIATSANISGHETAKKIDEIEPSILQSVDGICYDENVQQNNFNSTIIDLSLGTKNAKIIRQGSGDLEIVSKLVEVVY
ncbi:MAG: L-threonylcarbamoyladenylate synthase [Rickettsiales bacterium]|nr:L-threonylcarbamoyladenylate synthase [Rickettsiales bacterium]